MRQVDIGRGEVHARQRGVAAAAHVDAEHLDLAGRRLEQAEQHGDGRGLAGAVAAQQAEHGAARHREGQIVDCDDLAVHLAQVPDLDGGRLGHGRIIAP